ncbi:hypothetical protein Tco_0319846 [Tanacetum coccineum]
MNVFVYIVPQFMFELEFCIVFGSAEALNVDFDFKINLIVFCPETGSTRVSFSSGGKGCYRLKIHQLNHNQLLKSQRQQLGGQLCFFMTHLRVPYQYHDLTDPELEEIILLLPSPVILSAMRPLFLLEDELGTKALELRGASLELPLLYLASKYLVCLGSSLCSDE